MQTDLTSYHNKLVKLENYHDFAIDVTNACGGRKNVSRHLVSANQLFIRMTVSILSLIRLLPNNRHFPSDYEFWDLLSIHSLSRNIVETYIIFWYTSVDQIPDEERDLRLSLLRYHMNNEKYKLYKEFRNTPQNMLDSFETNIPLEKERLKKDTVFNKYVDVTKQKKY